MHCSLLAGSLSRDCFLFSSLILDRVLKSAVSFTCRKYTVGQISQQGKDPDMAEGNCWNRLVIPVMQCLLNMFHKNIEQAFKKYAG